MSKAGPLLPHCPLDLQTAEPSRNYARTWLHKKEQEKKRKMNVIEIHTHAYLATKLLLR